MDTGIPSQDQSRHAPEIDGAKFVDKTEKAEDQALALKAAVKTSSKNDPPGGFDATPFPRAPPGYTLKFTFHRAVNLPVSDFNSLSSDPFIQAQLIVDLPRRHKQNPDLTFRTPTAWRNVNPVWDAEWIVANVPASGFYLKCRIYDEDPLDHDDRLGNVHVKVDSIPDGWEGIKEESYRIEKRTGSKRAYFFRSISAAWSRDRQLDAHLIVSVECLGRTPGDNGGHMYTVGPLYWFKHFSPLIGRLTNTTDTAENHGTKGEIKRYKYASHKFITLAEDTGLQCPSLVSKRLKYSCKDQSPNSFTTDMSSLDPLWQGCLRPTVCEGASSIELSTISMRVSIISTEAPSTEVSLRPVSNLPNGSSSSLIMVKVAGSSHMFSPWTGNFDSRKPEGNSELIC